MVRNFKFTRQPRFNKLLAKKVFKISLYQGRVNKRNFFGKLSIKKKKSL